MFGGNRISSSSTESLPEMSRGRMRSRAWVISLKSIGPRKDWGLSFRVGHSKSRGMSGRSPSFEKGLLHAGLRKIAGLFGGRGACSVLVEVAWSADETGEQFAFGELFPESFLSQFICIGICDTKIGLSKFSLIVGFPHDSNAKT